MKVALSLACRVAIAVLCSARLAHASDWYVDAQSGSDLNNGVSALTAWRTLTHALAAIPSQPSVAQTIHVAPGVYDPQLGEVFPLRPAPLVWITGTQGSAATILQGSATSLLLYSADGTDSFDAASGADGLTLRDSATGIAVVATIGFSSPAFRDLAIEGMQSEGVRVWSFPWMLSFSVSYPTFERTNISGCGLGVGMFALASKLESAVASIDMTDCVVRNSTTDGLSVDASGNGSSLVRLYRCRVTDNGRDGVYAAASGNTNHAWMRAYSCIFANNQDAGAMGATAGQSSGLSFFYDCTIARNFVSGVRTATYYGTELYNSIVYDNGNDLDLLGSVLASWSNSGDGDLLGSPNCKAVNPMFVDAAHGDYRLRFGSPCVDTGDPSSAGSVDALSHMRPYDGDLDTQPAVDMGALEFEPLHISGAPKLGSEITFELWGAPGASSQLWLARQPIVAPQATPFGSFYLYRPRAVALLMIPIGPPAPAYLQRRVPYGPAIVGTTFSLQALTTSTTAPLGRALTNPVSLVIMP